MAHVAAGFGHFELVQGLCGDEGSFAYDGRVLQWAAFSGNLALVAWLLEQIHQGALFYDDEGQGACAFAARGGHLEVLKWLRGDGFEWCNRTCRNAVQHGHVEVLRWARQKGCPWDADTRDLAAEKLGYTDSFGHLYDDYY